MAILTGYQAGETMTRLAKQHGIRRQTVAAVLRRNGVAVREQRVLSDADVRRAAALHAQGWSTAKIAKEFGCAQSNLWRRLKEHGW